MLKVYWLRKKNLQIKTRLLIIISHCFNLWKIKKKMKCFVNMANLNICWYLLIKNIKRIDNHNYFHSYKYSNAFLQNKNTSISLPLPNKKTTLNYRLLFFFLNNPFTARHLLLIILQIRSFQFNSHIKSLLNM
jgi:hypothetical protein